MKTVDNYNFQDKKALIRVDFNVPYDDNYNITDDTRIKRSLPTIRKILNDGGSVILMSHLGRPKGEYNEKYSLKPVAAHLEKLLETKVQFAEDCIGAETRLQAQELKAGDVLLLENTRFHAGEKKGDEAMAMSLADLGNVYVNDAFGSAHRAHASTAVVAKYFDEESKLFGYLMADEVAHARKVLENTRRPFTAIIGGAKVSDKIQLIDQLLDKVDNLLIGGGMSYTFWKAKGGQIGKSLVEEEQLDLAKQLMGKAESTGVKLLLPKDSIIADLFDNEAHTDEADSNAIQDGWMGLDIGPKAREEYAEVIKSSQTILWNGPMGVFEMEPFRYGTKAVAEAVAAATQSNDAFSLIGGGDSVSAINKFGFADQVSFVSTGGGAMLEFFEGKTLPGIQAIEGT